MQLYIANCSKQRHDLIYRVPEESAPRRQQIPPGGQIKVYQNEIQPETARAIISQHEPYGLTDVKEIDRRRPFIGLCYSIDKPIKVDLFMRAEEHNGAVLNSTSQEARKLSAAALHDAIGKVTEQVGARLDALELEVLEQNGPTERGLNESVTVSRDAARAAARPSRRTR